jgi:hypothetical protein
MKHHVPWLSIGMFPRSKRVVRYLPVGPFVLAAILSLCFVLASRAGSSAEEFGPKLYVPYEDLVQLIEPQDKAMLMDRAQFELLLAAAKANTEAAPDTQLGQVTDAKYSAVASQDELTLTGELEVVSLSDRPVAVPLGFARIGLTGLSLDDKAAALGYDQKGKLTLIVTGRGVHRLEVAGTTKLEELSGGGMQFSLSVPSAVAAKMDLTAAGDLDIHTTVPASESLYDKQADSTSIELTFGGHDRLTAVLLGNGRQEDEQAIVLTESASTVSLTRSHQVLGCLHTVQVLRRGLRQLEFELPGQWTVTDVTCPSLVRWSVDAPEQPQAPKKLTIRLRSAKLGTTALYIQATAPRTGRSWQAPRVILIGAALQRGYLMIDADLGLRLRAETLTNARREDPSVASVPGIIAGAAGRLYFHWSPNWSVELQVATASLRRGIKEQQNIIVSPEQVTLVGRFEVTAIDQELFDVSFVLPSRSRQWHVQAVHVDGRQNGFEYRIEGQGQTSVMRIELARPIPAEMAANVTIVLQNVPVDWDWPAGAAARTVDVPVIESLADTVSGYMSVAPAGDLDAAPVEAPASMKQVPVGRIAALGLPQPVQYAYSYKRAATGQVRLNVSRRRPRVAAQAVGLITVKPQGLTGNWRITYQISRASAKSLYLLADKFLKDKLKITSTPLRISSKSPVSLDEQPLSLPAELTQRYDVWELSLDRAGYGEVVIDVSYELPLTEAQYAVPLVRPICPSRRQEPEQPVPTSQGRIDEMLAVQASEELALTVDSTGAKRIDAIDLPPLPVSASRILEALRLQAPTTPGGSSAAIVLQTAVHENYAVPSALAVSVELTTHIDVQGWQRTEATLNVANAGRQFLIFRLPADAELWSVQVAGQQAKPQRNAQGDYQLPLSRSTQPVGIRIVYAWRPDRANLEELELGGVEIPGVEINTMRWRLVPPPGMQITGQQTKMLARGLVRPKPAYIGVRDFLTENLFAGSVFTWTQRDRRHPLETAAAIEAEEGQAAWADVGTYRGYELEVAPPGEAVAKDKVEDKFMPRGPASQADRKEIRPADHSAGTQDTPLPESTEDAPVTSSGFRTTGLSVAGAARGRFTLPVELVATVGAGRRAGFEGLGAGKLIVSLTAKSRQDGWWIVGFAVVFCVGLALALKRARFKTVLIALVLTGGSLMATWWPGTTSFANGVFFAGLCLVPLYLDVALIRWLWPKLRLGLPTGSHTAVAAVVLLALLVAAWPTQAAEAPSQQQSRRIACPDKPLPELIIPYEGNPIVAEQSQKVLVSYSRFVELWNQAHPEDPIDGLGAGAEISLADVQYKVTVGAEQVELVLTARVRTYGKEWAVLGLPTEHLAVTDVTLDGKPARWQGVSTTADSGGGDSRTPTVLMLPGDTTSRLQLTAVTKPKVFGSRGSVGFSLPPLPAAVMKVVLPQEDLELEVDQIEGVPSSGKVNGEVQWTVPLGMTRKLTLRWQPKAGAGLDDQTLSAQSSHQVYAFSWAIVAATEIQYSFSAGRHDRFVLYVPAGVTLTDLNGANLRDWRRAGERTIEGQSFDIVQVRLHRPAKKQYRLTARWLAELPALDEATPLPLPRAGDVARESGTVILHAAAGMVVKAAEISGGRRVGLQPDKGQATTVTTRPVAKYYWPYRPFSLSVRLSRLTVMAKARLDQLVRISSDQVELAVEATVQTDQGQLFGADLVLPAGYELLNVVGPVVAGFYEDSDRGRRVLHVKFSSATQKTTMALVLLGSYIGGEDEFADFHVPTVTAVDPQGQLLAEQKGRIAVQLVTSLDAQTIAAENVKSVSPGALRDWLDKQQLSQVQFAYSYEQPNPSLRLKITAQPTEIRAETFVALVVRTTAASYTYRLRYEVAGSPIDHVRFQMPSEYAPLVAVQSPAMRSITQTGAGDGKTSWDLALVNEVTGTVDVAVNFSLPVDQATKQFDIPRLETAAPAGYRVIVAVQNISRHEITVGARENLEELPASEQRELIPQPVSQSLQYVYHSLEPDWSLSLDFAAAEPASRIQAVVDLLSLTTVVDRNGRCRYEARIALQNRSEQFLRVDVPDGLHLWSAKVADQPVKPVLSPDSPAGQVLIPLVKTSPGGLPYEVVLYFADQAERPLLKVLNGMTRLKPPAISIVGVPVMQTLWSLRLPDGYHYLRPGGNMSPVAGTAEMLSLKLDARLEQQKRMDQGGREVAGSGTQREQVFARDWGTFNTKLAGEIKQLQDYLEANRDEVSREDYDRLRSKLNAQRDTQVRILASNTAYVDKQVEFEGNNANAYLNSSAVNPGVAFQISNDAILEKPEFVGENERVQISNLEEEQVQVSALQEQTLQRQDRGRFAESGGTTTVDDFQTEAGVPVLGKVPILGDVPLIGGLYKKAEVDAVLEQLSEQAAEQFARKQVQIENQLAQMRDNRSERYFRRQQDYISNVYDLEVKANGRDRAGGKAGRAGWGGEQRGQEGRRASETRRVVLNAGVEGSAMSGPAKAQDTPAGVVTTRFDADAAETAAAIEEGVLPYVAAGTYSLPVTLPAGAVRLDFARPMGEAELSILAVPVNAIHRLYGSLAVLAVLFVLLAAVKLWPQPGETKPITVKRIILYVVPLVALVVLLGLLGLIVSVLVVLILEAQRGAFVHSVSADTIS